MCGLNVLVLYLFFLFVCYYCSSHLFKQKKQTSLFFSFFTTPNQTLLLTDEIVKTPYTLSTKYPIKKSLIGSIICCCPKNLATCLFSISALVCHPILSLQVINKLQGQTIICTSITPLKNLKPSYQNK